MALPASDDFSSYSAATLLHDAANWNLVPGANSLEINSGGVISGGGGEGASYWSADTPANDQWAQLQIVAIGWPYIGPAVRCSSSAMSYYGYYTGWQSASVVDSYLFKSVSGTWTQIGSLGGSVSVNDTLYLGVSGTTLTAKQNGSTTFTQTDSSLSSGYVGITNWASARDTSTRGDNWQGGNLGGQTIAPSLLTNTSTLSQPTLSPGAVSRTPALLTNTQTFHSPTVSAGNATITPSLLTNTQTFFAPTLTPGSVTRTPSLLTNTSTVYAPSVTPGAATLTPALLTNTSTLYAPTLTPGAATIAPALLSNTQTFYAPSVADPAARDARSVAVTGSVDLVALSGSVTAVALTGSVDPVAVTGS